MKILLLVIGILLIGCEALLADPIYYATTTGTNYENVTWHTAASKDAFEKLISSQDISDYSTVKHAKGQTLVHRTRTTPSGDWVVYFNHIYDEEGHLRQVTADFRTFTGHDRKADDFFPLDVKENIVFYLRAF
jgi:hypothetical protein